MKELEDLLGRENIKYNEPMYKHTSFKVGGPADMFVCVNTIEKLKKTIQIAKSEGIPYIIVGNGSNILVSDYGIDGMVIRYNNNDVEIDEDFGKNNKQKYEDSKLLYINDEDAVKMTCGAGALNGALAYKCFNNSITGFEFAGGIPGTIGGAVYMNAGAFGGEMSQIVSKVKIMDLDTLQIKILTNLDIGFSYRHSIFQNMKCVILEVELIMGKDDKVAIGNRYQEIKKKRFETQPLNVPSAGSIFKRGEDFIPAKLIDEAGLKGYTIGGAQVSPKHAGFIVNTGEASTKDVMELIEFIKNEIYKKYGVKLETEVRYIQ